MATVDVGPDLALTTLNLGSAAAGVGGTINIHAWSGGAPYQYTGVGNEAFTPLANQTFQVAAAERSLVSTFCSAGTRGTFNAVAGLVLRRIRYDATGGFSATGLVNGLAALGVAIEVEDCDFFDTAGAKLRQGMLYSGPAYVMRRCLFYGLQEAVYTSASGGAKVFASKFINCSVPVGPILSGQTASHLDGCSVIYSGGLTRLVKAGTIRNCAGVNLAAGGGNYGFESITSQDYNFAFGLAPGDAFVGAGIGGNCQAVHPGWPAVTATIGADLSLLQGAAAIGSGFGFGDPNDDGLDFDLIPRPAVPSIGAYEGLCSFDAASGSAGQTSVLGTFSEAMDAGNPDLTDDTLYSLTAPFGTVTHTVSAVTSDGATITATVTPALSAHQLYRLTVPTTVTAVSGAPIDAGSITADFVTGAADPVESGNPWAATGDGQQILDPPYEMAPADVTDGPGTLTDAVWISIFTDRRAVDGDELPDTSGDPVNRGGWWADAYQDDGDQIGSRLWLLSRSSPTDETLRRIEEYADEALAWMVSDGLAAKIETEAAPHGMDGASLIVRLYRQGEAPTVIRYDGLWDLWRA